MNFEKSFFQKVYLIVRRIPFGKVTTYGAIALMAGRPQSARYVGFAMRCAPTGLPCHRVVNKSGELALQDVFGSQALQRDLLASEGVTFLSDGRINMKAHFWDGRIHETI